MSEPKLPTPKDKPPKDLERFGDRDLSFIKFTKPKPKPVKGS